MRIDRPVFRLGIAGFTTRQQQLVLQAAHCAANPRCEWTLGDFAEADAWWVEGSRTTLLPGGVLRIAGGESPEAALQLALSEIDRPLAVALPLAPGGFDPAFWFRLEDAASMGAAFHKFSAWFQPAMAQYALAESIVREQLPLGAGAWELLLESRLIAVVDLRLGTAVAPDAGPEHFRAATWCIRDHGEAELPDEFVRGSLSEVMWAYAQRTRGDLLPAHYRSRPLYFRRPPKLAHGRMSDAHLLLLRELAARPASPFDELQQRTGLDGAALAHHLAALYLVGSITANPRRAWLGPEAYEADGSPASVAPSSLDSENEVPPRMQPAVEPTVPAELLRE